MKRIIKRQFVLLICILMVLGLTMNGCAITTPKEPEESESQQEETDVEEETEPVEENDEEDVEDVEMVEEEVEEVVEEPTPEEPSPAEESTDAETASKRNAKFADVLRAVKNDHVLPDGSEVYYEESTFGKIEDNEFALFDVDGDGEDELIIRWTVAPMAGMFERVYGYDETNDAVIKELAGFPAMEYYEKGIAKAMASHNHGTGGRFWPYTLFKYNKGSDVYDMVAFIDAWDAEVFPENYDGESFPEEDDVDGDKILYYISSEPYGGIGDGKYINIDELEKWLSERTGDGAQITFDTFTMTDENIENCANGTL